MPTQTADRVEDYSVGEDPQFTQYSIQLQAIAKQPPRSMAETKNPLANFTDTLLEAHTNRPDLVASFDVASYYAAFKAEAERQLIAALETRAANSAARKQSKNTQLLPGNVPLYDMSDRYREWYDRYGSFAGPALRVLIRNERDSSRLRMLVKIYLHTTWDFAFVNSFQIEKTKVIGTDGRYLGVAVQEVLEASMDKYLRFCPHNSFTQLTSDCVLLQNSGVSPSYIPALLAVYYHCGAQILNQGAARSIGDHFNAYQLQGDLDVLFDKVSQIAIDLGQAPEP